MYSYIPSVVLQVGSVPRVMGKLAVSKAFGNNSLKKYLTSEPDITIYKRTPDDIGLVIATDGLWNVKNNKYFKIISPSSVAKLIADDFSS